MIVKAECTIAIAVTTYPNGVSSITTSAGLRLGMKGAKVALGGLSTMLHGINQGDSFGEIVLYFSNWREYDFRNICFEMYC